MHIPQRELRPGTKCYPDGTSAPAWDVYLDGELIASEYASEAEALLELDLAAWHALFGDAALTPTALITDEAIGLAMQVFNRLFGSEKVQKKALDARDKILRPRIYTIHADGSLSVLATSGKGQTSYAVTVQPTTCSETDDASDAPRYRVTIACECRDFYTRAHAHGGICKHVAARMLLALAQRGAGALKHLRDALDTSTPSTVPSDISMAELTSAEPEAVTEHASAFVTIDASDLAAGLFLITRAALSVDLLAVHGTLRLSAGPIDLIIPCRDGDGTAAVRLEHATVTALYDQLRPDARCAGLLNLFVEPSDGSLFVCGEAGFAAEASGTVLTSEPAAHACPRHTPAPAADTPALDALHELFTLLETHEPEWYLRRHYRLAHTALHHAGRIA